MEQDELNLERLITGDEQDVKCGYQKTYDNMVESLSECYALDDAERNKIPVDHISEICS